MIKRLVLLLAAIASNAIADVLIEGDLNLGIQTHPEIPQNAQLLVTGAYTSGDRDNVEGLAIVNGEVLSDRYQNWDGVLIINRDGTASIANKRRVVFDGKTYDLTDLGARRALIDAGQTEEASLMQSHLLITDGELDVRPVENAPRFIRRILYTRGNRVGVYETDTPQTLFDSAVEIMASVAPDMALNLDMGAFNYCRIRKNETIESCGDPYVSPDRLTNFITLSQ